ncbi:MAG: serine hydrolase [bacterium]|nr:serine hydrolase [bacterium]
MKKYRNLLFGLGLFVAGGVVGALVMKSVSASDADREPVTQVRQSGYNFISPLLDCDPSSSASVPGSVKQSISQSINEIMKRGTIEFVSIYYRDLNNGPWFGVNEKEEFAPASLLKVPVMMTILKQAERDPAILDEVIENAATGQSESVRQLIERMIIASANDALDQLNLVMEFSELEDLHKVLGISYPRVDSPENYLTVKEYASLFRVLYNASYLNREMSEYALELLSRATYAQGLVAGVPESVVVSHKYGAQSGVLASRQQHHDCGIVYHPEQPYLICVMTKGGEYEQLISAVSSVSESVYNAVEKTTNN